MRVKPAHDALKETFGCLRLATRTYFTPFLDRVVPKLMSREERDVSINELEETFHSIVAHSLTTKRITNLLENSFRDSIEDILGISQARIDDDSELEFKDLQSNSKSLASYTYWIEIPSQDARVRLITEYLDRHGSKSKNKFLSHLSELHRVGLGGHQAEKLFARVMNDMMTDYIMWNYKGEWRSPSLVEMHLRLWVENVFARLIVEVMAVLHPSGSDIMGHQAGLVRFDDVEKWQEIAVARLGALRTSELFDVIVDWDSSRGAIGDLKQYASNTVARLSISSAFVGQLTQRLLHPGASTTEILQAYISIIRAFSILDPKGVLLDRAARPIRRYLRDREDTVQVIVGGLLADPAESASEGNADSSETLVELATELGNAHARNLQNESGELDWDDMSWMPDPIDAAADHKSSKGTDVVGSLISLFDSKEAFVKELQNMLSDRLLKKKADFSQEVSVLELLKLRFGDGALQACEVMLRDVMDSKRLDASILTEQRLAPKEQSALHHTRSLQRTRTELEFHSKILSRFFWPTLQDQPFNVPEEINTLQQRYSAGFETLKQSRKLTWLNALGNVTVELELADRTFKGEVSTWQATVIHAFQSESANHQHIPVTKTVSELAGALNMAPSLVRSACLFWVSKRILLETQRDSFRVLEELPTHEDHQMTNTDDLDTKDPSSEQAAATAAADAAAAAAAKETANAAAMEKMNLYWQFIVGMLTNQGAMPLQRIVMMLKIAVPGGFPFSNEELREFLAGMVAQGKLELVSGGAYKIMK